MEKFGNRIELCKLFVSKSTGEESRRFNEERPGVYSSIPHTGMVMRFPPLNGDMRAGVDSVLFSWL